MTITVLGAGGWIGSSLVASLRRQGRSVRPVNRAELPLWLSERDSQGPVIYAIGLTADFRQQPHATAEAHVCLLSQVLQRPLEHLTQQAHMGFGSGMGLLTKISR